MPERFRLSSTVTVLWGLLVLSVVVPVALFGLVAWQTREAALREAAVTTERTAQILHGHALNTFGSFELIIDRIADYVGERSWEDIESSGAVHALLKGLSHQHKQIGTVLLFDATGSARSSSAHFPTLPVNVADRDYFQAFRAGHRGTFVGETIRGRTTGNTAFNIARPLVDQDGQLRGAIVIAAFPSYFADFYAYTSRGLNHSAGLVRSDGIFLVRDAESKTSVEQPRASANFMRESARASEGMFPSRSTVDGVERMVAYKKLGDYPVYILYALGLDAINGVWRRQMGIYALFAVPAMIGLGAMTGFALVRTRREREAARRLADEMRRREETEAKLRDAQKMEALGQLTGGIAHDFNNLLTVVMGNLDLLRRAKDERRGRLIDNAMQAVEQGRRLTGQLLAFGRRQSLRPEMIDLNHLISSTTDMLAQSLRGDINLTLDLQPSLWLVTTDPHQFQIALINLAANARDAMPKGGELIVRTENTAHRDGGRLEGVVVSVSDTGIGIPREALSRVFEPFFTTKPVGKGTGLGLAQVYGFAQQSNGAVEIRSEEGRGTTVTLLLPRAQVSGETTSIQSDQQDAIPARQCRVLLVEDNQHVAEVARAMLSERGHSVQQASNAADALHVLEQDETFDLVLSDLVMPGDRDGLGLAQEVQRRWPDLPVLLATGYSEAATDAEQAGYSLLRKPYSPEALESAVQRTARRRAAGRQDSKVIPIRPDATVSPRP